MIKLEFPKANLNAYESAEDKVKALKGQVDTLSTNLQIILDSIDESIDKDAIRELVSPDIDSINNGMSEISDRVADIEDADYGTRVGELESHDYIVEQGTDGIWTYRKWDSGIAECWGTVFENTTNGACVKDFPSGLFINNDNQYFNVQATLYYGLGSDPNRAARALMLTDGSSSTQCVIYMRTTTNSAYSGYYGLRLLAMGRWK